MRPKVSIITPTYNHERFIAACIESVLEQSYTSWEMIVVDDGSTDGTADIVGGYRDGRIKLLRQNNAGIANLHLTYNRALGLAQGDIVGVLEGDDCWCAGKLEKQVPLFDDGAVALVWGAVEWIDTDGNRLTRAPQDGGIFQGLDSYRYLDRLLCGNFLPAVSVMVRKEDLVALGGFRQPAGMVTVDYPTWLPIILRGRVEMVQDVVACWRRHLTQVSSTRQLEMFEGVLGYACGFYQSLSAGDKARLAVDLAEIVRRWNRSFSVDCFHEGRKHLVGRRWQSARSEFALAIARGGMGMKLKSIVGLAASHGHFDVEFLARLFGKQAAQ